MNLKRVLRPGVIILLTLFALHLNAQEYINPCTGEPEFWTEEWLPDGTVEATFIGYKKIFDGDKIWDEVDPWCQQILSLVGAQCQGSGGVINPIGMQNQISFNNAVFSEKVIPLAVGGKKTKPINSQPEIEKNGTIKKVDEEEESGKAVMLEMSPDEDKPTKQAVLSKNNLSTDFEYDIFSHTGESGNNFLLRAGYAHSSDDGKRNYGFNFIFNTLLMMDQTFFNNALNFFGTVVFKESANHVRKGGITINTMLVDKDFGPNPFGSSVSVHLVNRRYFENNHALTYGFMLQESIFNTYLTSLLSAGLSYGFPLGKRLALNTDGLYTFNALSFTLGDKGGYNKIDNPQMLSIAENLDIFFSRLFSLTVGLKTTLLVKDYNDFIITIGASRRF